MRTTATTIKIGRIVIRFISIAVQEWFDFRISIKVFIATWNVNIYIYIDFLEPNESVGEYD